jgi:hypothetical protein
MKDVVTVVFSRTDLGQPPPTEQEIEQLRQCLQEIAPPLSDVTVTYSKEE